MSRDQDPDQRRWLSLGYGGKGASGSTWRYWKKRNHDRQWVIAAPNRLAEFEQHDTTVYYNGAVIVQAKTQWQATWGALAHFYGKLLQTLPPPELGAK